MERRAGYCFEGWNNRVARVRIALKLYYSAAGLKEIGSFITNQ